MVYAEGTVSAYNNMREVVGGLILQTSAADRRFDGERYAEFTVTHGCEVFLFRANDDYLSRDLGWVERDGYELDPLVKMQLRAGVGEGERYFRIIGDQSWRVENSSWVEQPDQEGFEILSGRPLTLNHMSW